MYLILFLSLLCNVVCSPPASQLIQIACERNRNLKFCQNSGIESSSTTTNIEPFESVPSSINIDQLDHDDKKQQQPERRSDFETELVFVSDYCVNNRAKYVDNCRSGHVLADVYQFCRSYPNACQGTDSVIPIVTYCHKYARQFKSICIGEREVVGDNAIQFCAAFSQFCYPEIYSKAAEMTEHSGDTSNSGVPPVLRRCDDVLHLARQVCNPFPSATDTFNTLRCTQFFKHCAKYVDWTTTNNDEHDERDGRRRGGGGRRRPPS